MTAKRYAILIVWGVLGLALFLLALTPGTWASPAQNDLRQTIPWPDPPTPQPDEPYNFATVCPSGECDFTTIQAAVDAASDGDTIKVAQGVYTSSSSQVMHVNKAITLTGGYATSDWTISYPVTQSTVIDAEGVAGRRGVYIDGTGVTTITLAGLSIKRGNAHDDDGGGVYVLTGTVVLRANCVLDNSGGRGGGVYVLSGTVRMSHNCFWGNSAESSGGGAYLAGGIVRMSHNSLWGNSAQSSGGGVYLAGTTTTLTGNSFQSNSAEDGGGVYMSGNTLTMSRNFFQDNSAALGRGGGIAIAGGTVNAWNDVIANNTAVWEGVYLSAGTLTARHWTLVNNGHYALITIGGSAILTNTIAASHTDGGFWGSSIAADHTLFSESGTPCSAGASCTSNFSGDPDFANPAANDYHIGPSSAALDRGVDAGVYTDMDNWARPYQAPDLGADEFWPPSCFLPFIMRRYW